MIAVEVRVLTWNLRVCLEAPIARVAAVLADAAPDVVALQEVGCGWVMGPPGDLAAQVASAAGLPFHQFFPALWTEPGLALRGLGRRLWPLADLVADGRDPAALPRYGIALLSRFPIRDEALVPLPRVTDEPRVLAAATLDAPHRPLRVLLTHLSTHADDRREQTRVVVAALGRERGPALLLGDLNDVPESPTLARLGTVARDLGAGATGREGLTYPAEAPVARLDYILARGAWRVRAPARPLPIVASDHLPVLAVLEPAGGV